MSRTTALTLLLTAILAEGRPFAAYGAPALSVSPQSTGYGLPYYPIGSTEGQGLVSPRTTNCVSGVYTGGSCYLSDADKPTSTIYYPVLPNPTPRLTLSQSYYQAIQSETCTTNHDTIDSARYGSDPPGRSSTAVQDPTPTIVTGSSVIYAISSYTSFVSQQEDPTRTPFPLTSTENFSILPVVTSYTNVDYLTDYYTSYLYATTGASQADAIQTQSAPTQSTPTVSSASFVLDPVETTYTSVVAPQNPGGTWSYNSNRNVHHTATTVFRDPTYSGSTFLIYPTAYGYRQPSNGDTRDVSSFTVDPIFTQSSTLYIPSDFYTSNLRPESSTSAAVIGPIISSFAYPLWSAVYSRYQSNEPDEEDPSTRISGPTRTQAKSVYTSVLDYTGYANSVPITTVFVDPIVTQTASLIYSTSDNSYYTGSSSEFSDASTVIVEPINTRTASSSYMMDYAPHDISTSIIADPTTTIFDPIATDATSLIYSTVYSYYDVDPNAADSNTLQPVSIPTVTEPFIMLSEPAQQSYFSHWPQYTGDINFNDLATNDIDPITTLAAPTATSSVSWVYGTAYWQPTSSCSTADGAMTNLADPVPGTTLLTVPRTIKPVAVTPPPAYLDVRPRVMGKVPSDGNWATSFWHKLSQWFEYGHDQAGPLDPRDGYVPAA